MMCKEFTKKATRKWINMLDMLFEKYNNKLHRSLDGHTPKEIFEKKPKLNNIDNTEQNEKKNKYKVGDRVRISYKKGVFDKQYLPQWSFEIYTINI